MTKIAIENEAHWHQLRAKNVGGSEIAALFNVSPHTTPFELWHRKAGLLPDVDLSDNDRVFWGSILEPAIAEGARIKTGWAVRKVHDYITDDQTPGFACTLDYEIIGHPKGPGVMEIKNVDGLVHHRWDRDEAGTKEPPLSFLLQAQAQMAVTGYSWGVVSCLIGGNHIEIYEYDRRETIIAEMRRLVEKFWDSVKAGTAPDPNFSEDLDSLKILHSASGNGFADMTSDNRLADLCAEYVDAGAAEKAGKKRKDAAKAEMLTKIGSFDKIGVGVFSISAAEVKGGTVNYERKPYRGFRVNQKKG